MTDSAELGTLTGAALGGVVGYAAGFQAGHQQASQQFQTQAQELADYQIWRPFITTWRGRMEKLISQRVVKPLPAINIVPNLGRIFAEAVNAYLYELTSSTVFSVGRSLEVALKAKYVEETKQDKRMDLDDLIEWCETLNSKHKNIAASCRLLRNTIHNDEPVEDPEALSALRNCSGVLNEVYPYVGGSYLVQIQCPACGRVYPWMTQANLIFIGNNVITMCDKCHVPNPIRVNPL